MSVISFPFGPDIRYSFLDEMQKNQEKESTRFHKVILRR